MAIDGTKVVVLRIVFAVPPGMDPTVVGNELAKGGVTLALGLTPYIRNIDCTVEDAPLPGVKLL